ncbi:MAG: sulfite exporter TauE/SafE family protein [Deltaproteobacteria bacterium]|nr:MAG: sulfite exporter TauE/SafE family protein [Deltaproteobacteria bacterium]
MLFSVSGVETSILLPPLVAFVISFFSSMAGITGAFLILPFQMSVLGFTSPSVSATNFLYNVVGTPGGILRYMREGRMVWPLALAITIGTLPGVLVGYYIRVRYLPDPKAFKLFVGIILLYIGFRVLKKTLVKVDERTTEGENDFEVRNVTYSLTRMGFDFQYRRVEFSHISIMALALVVGIIGGIYGIGGGAIIAPFCVAFLNIPVHTVAGAAIFGTFATSIVGVAIYSLVPFYNGSPAPPDWLLGILFGLGGLVGMYLGASCQRFVPERIIQVILAVIIFVVSIRYIVQFFV